MIRAQKTPLTPIQGLPATHVGDQSEEIRHLQSHAGTGMTQGHLDDVGTPEIGAAIVGRPSGVKPMTGPVALVVIIVPAGLADVTGSEHVRRRLLGRVHHHGGVGRPQDGISGGMEIGGMIIDGDEV